MRFVILLALCALSSVLRAEGQRINLTSGLDGFHSLSGIVVFDHGQQFVTISDKGYVFLGVISRESSGEITNALVLDGQKILTSKGVPVYGQHIDAEEIDRDHDGNFYISFESNSRVSRFPEWNAPAILIPRHPDFLSFGFNSGPEAMAIGKGGRLWLAPERSGRLERPFPIYEFDGAGWEKRFDIRRAPPFLLVSMDYDDQSNRLYVLERDHNLFQFRSRIRSFVVEDAVLANEQLVWQSDFGDYGNLEGMSLWYDANSQPHLTLVADNGRLPFAANQLLEFVIDPSTGLIAK